LLALPHSERHAVSADCRISFCLSFAFLIETESDELMLHHLTLAMLDYPYQLPFGLLMLLVFGGIA
jgi:hypothetical protein